MPRTLAGSRVALEAAWRRDAVDEAELRRLRDRLEVMRVPALDGLLVGGDPIDRSTVWVRPELVAEVKFTGWAGFGRIRHAADLGLREDKSAAEVVRDVADRDPPRLQYRARPGAVARKGGMQRCLRAGL